jgi:hypothetical protein
MLPAIFHNTSPKTHLFNKNGKCAQIIFYPYTTPTLTQLQTLDNTQRGTGGFGSTDHPVTIIASFTTHPVDTTQPSDLLPELTMPYNIVLSNDPYDDTIQITVHHTLPWVSFSNK